MSAELVIPSFVPERYFARRLDAYGVFVDRFGAIRRQFEVAVAGQQTDTGFILDESFRYDDGETEDRRWEVTALGEGRYEGRSADVVGIARGLCAANMLRWRYTFRLAIYGHKVTVAFDDVMVLQGGDILVNRATVSKAGFRLGEVLLSFRPS
jgi:hypothetical protein